MTDLTDENGHGLLTTDLLRIFLGGGCGPACHTCYADIEVGEKFAMVSAHEDGDGDQVTTEVEVMVCWNCLTTIQLIRNPQILRWPQPSPVTILPLTTKHPYQEEAKNEAE